MRATGAAGAKLGFGTKWWFGLGQASSHRRFSFTPPAGLGQWGLAEIQAALLARRNDAGTAQAAQ